MSTVSNAIQMLVPSEASALPRGANTRAQNVKPNSCGNLLGKYHFSANAQRNRLASGPKITNANNASRSAMPNIRGQPDCPPALLAWAAALTGTPTLGASPLRCPQRGSNSHLGIVTRAAGEGPRY